MPSSEYGITLRLILSGTSHGPEVNAELNGLPAGIPLAEDGLSRFMARRRGGGPLATPRREADIPVFSSGLTGGVTDGSPLQLSIKNENTRSVDYDGFRDTPRPSHADYTAQMRYGQAIDLRGGGHFSGRLTAPLCAAGFLCLTYLASRGIRVGAHLEQVGAARDERFDPVQLAPDTLTALADAPFPVLRPESEASMTAEIRAAAAAADSVGGIVECGVTGLPAGIGEPLFDGIENRLTAALFGLGGVRGVEFGDGFAACGMRGSEHNDPFRMHDGRVVTATNHCGGVQGGISDGMPLIFRCCFKPTASIGREQETVSLSRGENTTLTILGRHDPCIALRAVPCVEALTALTLTDLILTKESR